MVAQASAYAPTPPCPILVTKKIRRTHLRQKPPGAQSQCQILTIAKLCRINTYKNPVNIASKRLTQTLTSLESTLTENPGEGGPITYRLITIASWLESWPASPPDCPPATLKEAHLWSRISFRLRRHPGTIARVTRRIASPVCQHGQVQRSVS